MLQNEESAGDAVQDSFLKAYRALGGFKGGLFKSWLLRIVVNTCYDVLRVQQRYISEPIDDDPHSENEDGHVARQLVDSNESPDEYVERMELSSHIELGIRNLSGAATYTKVSKGKTYRFSIRTTGDPSLVQE